MVRRSYHLVRIAGRVFRNGSINNRPDNLLELQHSALEPIRIVLPKHDDTTYKDQHWAVLVYHPYEGAFVIEATYKVCDDHWTGVMSGDAGLGPLFEKIIRAHVALLDDEAKDADPDTQILASLIGGGDDKPGSAPRGAD